MTDHKRSGPGRGGRSTITADAGKRTADRPWSAAHPALTETDVRDRVMAATIRELARAIDPGAFHGDHGTAGFACPRCEQWAAEITSASLWYCAACEHTGTRFGLAQLVLADGIASTSLATGQVTV